MNALASHSSGRLLTLLTVALLWCSVDAAIAAETSEQARPRIVSLAPHLTELAFDAGIGDALVGVVEWSDYPAAAASLPRIGDAFRFDLEQILQLDATHALAWGGGTPSAAIAGLEALDVTVEVIEISTLDQIAAAIERLGALGGRPDKASASAADFRARLARFRTRHPPGRAPTSIFYQVSERPLFTLGARHVINEVLALCHGVNVFEDLDTEAASVDLEAVLARDPRAILIGGGDGTADPETLWASFQDLHAVACDNILHVDPALLVRPTPRVLDGAGQLCAWLDEEVREPEDPACRAAR